MKIQYFFIIPQIEKTTAKFSYYLKLLKKNVPIIIEKFKNIGREKKKREFALATISYFQTTATAEQKS